MLLEGHYHSLSADFAQKVRAVVAKLEVYDKCEQYHHRCYELRHDKKALSAYCDSVDPHFLKSENVITPEFLEQNKNGVHLSEDRFFSHPSFTKGRNILLVKHRRYTPRFIHKHDFFEILFVLQGQSTDSIAGKEMVLPAGSLCIISPETFHSTEVFDDSIVIYFMIKRSTFDEVFVNLLTASNPLSGFFLRTIYNKKSEYLVFNIANDTELLEQLLAIIVENDVNDEESGRIMEHQISIFLSLLQRKYGNSPLVYQSLGIKEQHWKIIAYINKHFRTLTHAKLAAKFGLSIGYCSRLIKSITGKNFTTLVHELRMNHAKTMVSQSDMKIYDISFSLGYEDQGTFIRNFKKAHGITPVQYRKENTGKRAAG